MSKRRDPDEERMENIRRQIELYQGQRAKHKEIVEGEPGRRFYLNAEIEKRLEAIAVMRQELEELPVKAHLSRAVISRLNEQIATLKKKREDIKIKRRKIDQLGRVRLKIDELEGKGNPPQRRIT